MRYLIHLAYKGTHYHGWQKQHNAHSVQGVLDEKLSLLLSEKIETLGCGRTDTGVHAKNFYAHFDTNQQIDYQHLVFKLNLILPKDIAIFEVRAVQEDFNARFDADWRAYEYWITQTPNPFLLEFAWYQYATLDVVAMNEAAALLIGKHDFKSFSKVHTQVNNFFCEVFEATWTHADGKLVFSIKANRFLRNMVRAIVGTLIEVGRGKLSKTDLLNILASKNRCEAGQSVPAHGLYLTDIYYNNLQA